MESDIDLLTSLVDEAGDYYIKYMLSYLGSGSWHSCDAPTVLPLYTKLIRHYLMTTSIVSLPIFQVFSVYPLTHSLHLLRLVLII